MTSRQLELFKEERDFSINSVSVLQLTSSFDVELFAQKIYL